MTQNQSRLRHGQVVIATIKATVEDIRRSLPDFIHKFYHSGEMKKIQIMVYDAKNKVFK